MKRRNSGQRKTRLSTSHVLKGRPCGFGQCLWPTNCQVNFSFFWGQPKKLSSLRDRTIFLSTLLNFFVQSFLKIGHPLIRDWTKKQSLVSETGHFFCWPTQKNEKLTGQLVSQETDQNHVDVPKIKKPSAGLYKKDFGWDNFEMVGKRHHLFYFKWAALSWQATALYCKKSSRITVDI